MSARNSEAIRPPGFFENAWGTLAVASLIYMGIVLLINIPDAEVLALPEEIPGIGAFAFFGDLWLRAHSRRLGMKKEDHPLHPVITGVRSRRRSS